MELYLKNNIMVMQKNIVNKKTLSSSKDKRSQLLIKVDNLMEKLDNEYGPFLLDELNKRLEQTIEKLVASRLKCYYCKINMKLFYKKVRDMDQWTLDRINNDIGHNNNNVVICCLKCNINRRTTNDEYFKF